jgi:hypothetical protein
MSCEPSASSHIVYALRPVIGTGERRGWGLILKSLTIFIPKSS